jgi:hypothetical protein
LDCDGDIYVYFYVSDKWWNIAWIWNCRYGNRNVIVRIEPWKSFGTLYIQIFTISYQRIENNRKEIYGNLKKAIENHNKTLYNTTKKNERQKEQKGKCP